MDLCKTYLGDAVYADVDERGIVLTTENGVCATNLIVLDPEVVLELERFVAACRKAGIISQRRSHA